MHLYYNLSYYSFPLSSPSVLVSVCVQFIQGEKLLWHPFAVHTHKQCATCSTFVKFNLGSAGQSLCYVLQFKCRHKYFMILVVCWCWTMGKSNCKAKLMMHMLHCHAFIHFYLLTTIHQV